MTEYTVRGALPEEAEDILRLSNADFVELGFPAPPSPTKNEVDALAERIQHDPVMRRIVALGDEGIAAYAKIGPWDKGGYVHTFGNPIQRATGGLHRNGTGLFTFAVSPAQPGGYRSRAANAIIDEAGIFDTASGDWKIPVAGINLPDMARFTDLLTSHGTRGTRMFGNVVLNGTYYRSELWTKTARTNRS